MRIADVPLDLRVLLYAFGLALLTGALVGLVPARPATRAPLTESLRDGSRVLSSSTGLRKGLIVAQVAMTVVLLCGAGLLVRSMLALTGDPTGAAASSVLTMRVQLPLSRYDESEQVAFFRQATESLEGLAGVELAAAARDIPMSMALISGTGFRVLGGPELPDNELPSTLVRVVTPGYFETLGIPIQRGREFAHQDPAAGSPPVFVVNEAFAERYLATVDPLLAQLSVRMQRPENPFGPIVGVVGNVKDRSLRGIPEPTVFYSDNQLPSLGMTFLIRTTRGAQIAGEAISVIRAIDANLPVTQVRMLDDAFAESVARDRLNAVVSAAFALNALLLASLGLYGLLGYTVVERTREIGVRMALGARAAEVLRMVMLQGLRLVAIGAVLGFGGALALSQLLESLLYGITGYDVVTFLSIAGVLTGVSILAVVIPARRATRILPTVALRGD